MAEIGGSRVSIPRPAIARIGCCLLNLLQPGLGLLRIGDWRRGLLFLLAPFAWLIGSILLFAVTSQPRFIGIVSYVAVAILFLILLFVSAMATTWRGSALIIRPLFRWSRWYTLVAVLVASDLCLSLLVPIAHGFYKPFYLPSEAMAPTLGKYDRIVADMRRGRRPKRGEVVLIKIGEATYIKRVVGLSGDYVAIRNDIPIINGVPAQVHPAGSARFLGIEGWETATLLHERLPGAAREHDIAIIAGGPFANMRETIVPAGHIFVLGDNRDRSADSRVPHALGGVEMVSLEDVVGQPLYITWSRSRDQIGRAVDH